MAIWRIPARGQQPGRSVVALLPTATPLTLTLSDDLNNWSDTILLGYGFVFTEALTLATDALVLGYGLLAVENALNFADAVVRTIEQRFLFTDSINNWLDASAKQQGITGTGADTLNAWADVHAKFLSYQLALADTEAANWADAQQLLLAQFLALTDSNTANWNDAASLSQQLNLTVSDSINNLADAFAKNLANALITLTPNDSISVLGTLWDDAVASWRLSDLTDATSRGNTLTNNNSATFNTGKIGNAAYFSRASSQSLSIADNPDVSTGPVDFTIGLWVYLDDKTNKYNLLAKDDQNTGNREYSLAYEQSVDRFDWNLFEAGSMSRTARANTLGSPSAGVWYCILVGYDTATQKSFISVNNGALDLSVVFTPQASGTADFAIGAKTFSGIENFLNGRVDNVTIWKKVLTSDERTEFYNAGVGIEFPPDPDSITVVEGLLVSFSDSTDNWGDSVQLRLEQQLNFVDSTNNWLDAFAKNLASVASNIPLTLVDSLAVNIFVYDTFTDTDGLALLSHTGETGSPWVKHSSFTDLFKIQSNTAGKDNGTGTTVYYATGVADTMDYTVEADIVDITNVQRHSGIVGWVDTASDTMVWLRRQLNNQWSLTKVINGTVTNLDTAAATFSAGKVTRVKMTRTGDDFEWWIDGVSQGVFSITDPELQIIGKAGVRSLNNHLGAGYHIDNFSSYSAGLEDSVEIALSASSADLTLTLADTLTAQTDALQLIEGQLETFSDSTNNWSDSYSAILRYNIVIFEDAFSLSDSLSRAVGNSLSLADTLNALTDSLAIGYGFVISENVFFLNDSINVGYGLRITDSFTLSDSIQVVKRHLLSFSDTLNNWSDSAQIIEGKLLSFADSTNNWGDSVQIVLGQQLTFSDNINSLLDSLAIGYGFIISENVLFLTDSVSGGYGLIITDSFTLTDSEEHALGLQLSFAENILNLNDSIQIGYGFVVSDNVSFLNDSIRNGYGLLITDSFTLTDSIQFSSFLQLSLSDSITLTDSIQLVLGYRISAADSINNLADSAQIIEGKLLSFTDSFTLTDSAARLVGVPLSFSDTLSLTDSLRIGYGLLFTDSINNWNDQVLTNAPQPANVTRIFVDSIDNWQDSLAATLVYLTNFSETYVQTDSLVIGYGLLVTDSANTLTDTATVNLGLLKSFSDSFVITDSIALSLGYSLALSDSFTLTDSYQQILGLRLNLTDSANSWLDSIDLVSGDLLGFSDSFTITDSLQIGYGQNLSDTILLTDSISLQLNQQLALSDSFTLTDSYQQVLGLQLNLSDTANNWLDSIVLVSGDLLSVSDSFTITDSIEIGKGQGLSDALLFTDSIRLQLNYLLNVSDNLHNFSDSIVIVLGIPLQLSDSIDNLQDQTFYELNNGISCDDSFSLTDSIQLQLNYFIQLFDQFTLTDSFAKQTGTPGGLELEDDLNNWQDAFKKRFRSVFGDRIVNVPTDERVSSSGPDDRTTTIPADPRSTPISGQQRVMIVPEDDPVPPGDINND